MSVCRIVGPGGAVFDEARELVQPLLKRFPRPEPTVIRTVSKILADIEKGGVRAAVCYARKFDCPTLKLRQFAVTKREIAEATVPREHHAAIVRSIEQVRGFHEEQLKRLTQGWSPIELRPKHNRKAWQWTISPTRGREATTGFEGQRLQSVWRVGVYVPGGKAAYPSSVIMNAVPAMVAGTTNVAIATPARPDGSIHPAILVAARELGIVQIVKVGGAAAIGFLAMGDNFKWNWLWDCDWGPCDVVVGPGNAWVNEAKRQLWGRVGLDSYAGPSEVCVVVDDSANAAYAAADLLTQVEHSEDNLGVLIGTSLEKVEEVLREVDRQMTGAPREATMRKALAERGLAVVVGTDNKRRAFEIKANWSAAEHLSLMVENPEEAAMWIRNAGCILLGDYTPQSAGDFVSGPSHTLPTNLGARFASPVNVMTFLKFQSISKLTKEDLAELRPTIEAFAEMEGFPQHGRGASIRFEE